jgi:hypothetical protein
MKTAARKDECTAPIALLLGGRIRSEDPEIVIREERLRVGIFTTFEKCPECGENIRWLQIEFLNDDEWHTVLNLDERNFSTMMSVFNQVGAYLDCRAA